MGYTIHWEFKNSPKNIKDGKKKFNTAVQLLKKCVKNLPANIVLRGGRGVGKPVFNGKMVCFNGSQKRHEDYETCYIPYDDSSYSYSYEFCKTEHLPYDAAVCLTVLCFKEVFGDDFSYRSDGGVSNDEKGWLIAHKIFEETVCSYTKEEMLAMFETYFQTIKKMEYAVRQLLREKGEPVEFDWENGNAPSYASCSFNSDLTDVYITKIWLDENGIIRVNLHAYYLGEDKEDVDLHDDTCVDWQDILTHLL